MVFTMPWEDVASFPGAGSVSRLVGLMVAGTWVVSVVTTERMRAPRAPHLFAVLFVLWNACTLMWTADGPATQERVFTYAQDLVLMVIVWDTVTTLGKARQTLFVYLAGCYVTAVSLVVNLMAGKEDYHGRATVGTFNPNDVSMILALGLPVAGYLVMSAGRGPWLAFRLAFGLLYIPLSGFAILVTGSRTALAALIPGIAYLAYRLARRRPGLAIGSLGALALLSVLAYPLAPPAVRLHLAGTESEIASGDLNERAGIWAEAIRLIHDHPVLGIGAGAFREAAVGANKVGHNFVLSLLSEVGAVGFGLFLALLVTALLSLRHMPPLLREMWLALFSAWLLAALLHNWEYRKQTWLFLGLVTVCGALGAMRQADRPPAHQGRGTTTGP
jgi:O-antigen ligase